MGEARLTQADAGGGDVEISDPGRLPPDPLVSVFMITYNHVGYIREALDSVLMQQVDFPYEICLGEDGSTDGTRQILLEYARAHPDKIRLFLRNRANPARQRYAAPFMHNTIETWNACRGKYIALLEGDDYWTSPAKLAVQTRFLETHSSASVCAHYAVCAPDGQPWRSRIIPDCHLDTLEIAGVLRRDIGNVHTSTWLLRRVQAMPWERFCECNFGDYPLLVWTLLHGTGHVLPWTMSTYRIHAGGVFGPLSNVQRVEQNVVLSDILYRFVPDHAKTAAAVGTVTVRAWLIGDLRKAGRHRDAIRCFTRTLARIASAEELSGREKNRLRLLACQSLLLPRLRGLQDRWRRWLKAHRAFEYAREAPPAPDASCAVTQGQTG